MASNNLRFAVSVSKVVAGRKTACLCIDVKRASALCLHTHVDITKSRCKSSLRWLLHGDLMWSS